MTENYIDNKQFTRAIVEYTTLAKEARENDTPEPPIPNYIGECFMLLNERLSLRPNFRNYTFRDEMVADGIENCVKAIHNYDPEAATRSGYPNAFGYFTQISFYAQVRRIQKEQKESKIKHKMIMNSTAADIVDMDISSLSAAEISTMNTHLDTVRGYYATTVIKDNLEEKDKDKK